jgi:hypothetical protein
MGRAALWNDARRRTGAWREARLLEQKAHVSCEGTMIRVEEGPHFERIRHTRADHFLKVEHAQSRAVGCDGFRHRPLDQEPARLVNNPRGAVGRVIARTEGGGRIRAGLARQPRARRYQDPVFLSPIGNGFYAASKKAPGRAKRQACGAQDNDRRPWRSGGTPGVRQRRRKIPPEMRDKLFQPFFTTKPTAKVRALDYRSAETLSPSSMAARSRSIVMSANTPNSSCACRAHSSLRRTRNSSSNEDPNNPETPEPAGRSGMGQKRLCA